MLTDLRTALSSATFSALPELFLVAVEIKVGMFGLEAAWLVFSSGGLTTLEGVLSADCGIEEDAEGILVASEGMDGVRSLETGN